VTRADAARACWDLGGREEAAKVAVAKAGGRKLAAADSGERRHVVGVTDAQGADTAPAVSARAKPSLRPSQAVDDRTPCGTSSTRCPGRSP